MSTRTAKLTLPQEAMQEAMIGALPVETTTSGGGTTDVMLPTFVLPAFAEGDAAPERTASLSSLAGEINTDRHPCLVVLAGAHESEIVKLRAGAVFTLGRAEDCDLVLEDEGVSRQHARFFLNSEGAVVEDLGSRNGTFVGAERVQQRVLAPDDVIRVGARTALKYCRMDAFEEEFQARMLQAALRDSLTGLYNRRHFDERLASECASARRHGRPFSLALFDIDDFKSINDRYGHQAGDEVLRAVAQILEGAARKEDAVFRYGGEELAIMFRETALGGALEASERRREAVAGGRFALGDGRETPITLSCGVAELAPGLRDGELVERADAALYQAKRAGKNRVLSFTG